MTLELVFLDIRVRVGRVFSYLREQNGLFVFVKRLVESSSKIEKNYGNPDITTVSNPDTNPDTEHLFGGAP